jgi:hypothetical protein
VAEISGKRVKVLLDNSDSCFHLSSLIAEVDLYFCGAYTSSVFVEREFISPYAWQQREDLEEYKKKFRTIVENYGEYFGRIRKSIPMPMLMKIPQFIRSNRDFFDIHRLLSFGLASFFPRISRRLKMSVPSFVELMLYRMRFQDVLAFRQNPLRYDIVAIDSLWAWPWHRVLLHRELRRLSSTFSIFSQLAPDNPRYDWWHAVIPPDELPRVQQEIQQCVQLPEPYEKILTSSRLNVYATGKHWGWRQIMFISLLCGIPILMDRPVYETHFDFNKFTVYYTADEWQELESTLRQVSPEEWQAIKKKNQQVFDTYLAPLAVAQYIHDCIVEFIRQGEKS